MDNEQMAFPYEDGPYTKKGMTMRQYYKAKAMAALITKIPLMESEGRDGAEQAESATIDEIYKGVSTSAGFYADAMLAEDAEHAKGGEP